MRHWKPAIRALLLENPRMPATVLAERWIGSDRACQNLYDPEILFLPGRVFASSEDFSDQIGHWGPKAMPGTSGEPAPPSGA